MKMIAARTGLIVRAESYSESIKCFENNQFHNCNLTRGVLPLVQSVEQMQFLVRSFPNSVLVQAASFVTSLAPDS